MSIIKQPNLKSVEMTDLESHVMLAEQRRKLLETRLERLEAKFLLLEDREHNSRNLILGSLATIGTAILTTIIAITYAGK
jgi:hypothetical protein